ncbi:MAG: PilZ domain-containing protein [Spirochaetaceae bacterium]|nr:PilZ domain-containing protein [Spirochaetaceae bacterium]
MQEKRKSIRYTTRAQATIPGFFDSEALLKDISVTGCCIEAMRWVNIQPDMQCTIQIIPEPDSKIGKFELTAQSRWTRNNDDSCEIGFLILESPKGKHFQRYVDYLAYRAS